MGSASTRRLRLTPVVLLALLGLGASQAAGAAFTYKATPPTFGPGTFDNGAWKTMVYNRASVTSPANTRVGVAFCIRSRSCTAFIYGYGFIQDDMHNYQPVILLQSTAYCKLLGAASNGYCRWYT